MKTTNLHSIFKSYFETKLSLGLLFLCIFSSLILIPENAQAQPDHLVITRVCDDGDGCSVEWVEVFNPTGDSLTLTALEEGANGCRWGNGCGGTGSVTLGSGDYYLFADGTNSYNGASVDQNITLSPTSEEGFRITQQNGDTDAVGWDLSGNNADVSNGFFEGNVIDANSNVDASRNTDVNGFPIDTQDNASDFTENDSDMTPKTGYSSAAGTGESSITIKSPADNTDTLNENIRVSGTSSGANSGDSVAVLVNDQDTKTSTIQSDSSWSVQNVKLNGIRDIIKVKLFNGSVSDTLSDTGIITVSLVSVPDHLVITRICDDGNGCSAEWVEVFNPTRNALTLSALEEEANGCRWGTACGSTGSVTLQSGEYYLFGDGITTYNGATIDQGVTLSPGLDEGFRITQQNGDTDAAGWDETGNNADVNPGFFEGNVINANSNVDASRDTIGEGIPVDTQDNQDDFTENNADMTPKTGYSATPVPDFDTSSILTGDGSDTHFRPNLNNKNRLKNNLNHEFKVKILNADTASIFLRRDGKMPSTGDTEILLTNSTIDTYAGTLTQNRFSPGDSVSFLIFATSTSGETTVADSEGMGYKYRVDPRIDSDSLKTTDGTDTLGLSSLDGSESLQNTMNHNVLLKIPGADTSQLFYNIGTDPTTASSSDTAVSGSRIKDPVSKYDTWNFSIPNSDFQAGDSVNFIVTAQLISSATVLNDTITEDSTGLGFEYDVVRVQKPPKVTLRTPDTDTINSFTVPGTYVLVDFNSDPGTVTVEVSDDSGSNWDTTATLSGEVENVSSSVSGDTHNFTWDSLTDLGRIYDTDIKLRIKAFDGIDTGIYDTSGAFTIDNIIPPAIKDLASTASVNLPDTGVNLFWSSGSSDVQFFRIYRSFRTSDTSMARQIDTATTVSDSITYRDNSVTQGDSYFYYVTAVDSAGNESDSSNITAAAHVTLKKTQTDTGSYRPGDTVIYTIRYANNGFAPSQKLILEDAIPDLLTLGDTSTVISGPSVSIEYFNANTESWQSSSFPRKSISQIRWTVDQNLDPKASGFEGAFRFKSVFN